MTITLPAELEQQITPQEAALHLAIGQFADDKVTLGQAAAVAGISQPAFMHELGKRKIPIHYGAEELEQDIATVEKLSANFRQPIMLVVSDTSPVSALIQVARAELLRDLFGIVCIPPAVNDELLRFHSSLPSFIEVRQVADRARVESLMPKLDVGEAEAIILAIETHADHLLIDERRGRQMAAEAGVPTIGLVGVLLLAKTRGLVPVVKDLFVELQMKSGFYLADSLIEKALQAAGE